MEGKQRLITCFSDLRGTRPRLSDTSLRRAWRGAAGGTVDPALARLGPAVTRGLLVDLVATNDDDAGVTSAARACADLVGRGRSDTDGPRQQARGGAVSQAMPAH